jgi:hypothetical protein
MEIWHFNTSDMAMHGRTPCLILATHGPPKAHLDHGIIGCAHLLAELWRVQPWLQVFGRIHAGEDRTRLNIIIFKWIMKLQLPRDVEFLGSENVGSFCFRG